jgi:hypothetical protein
VAASVGPGFRSQRFVVHCRTRLPDDWTVFGLAGLLLGIGLVLYGVNVLVKRSLDREIPEATRN